jgi:hypothetical protein
MTLENIWKASSLRSIQTLHPTPSPNPSKIKENCANGNLLKKGTESCLSDRTTCKMLMETFLKYTQQGPNKQSQDPNSQSLKSCPRDER